MASNFQDLNEDLISEILLRLPVKSILRFKTVSKQWLSIVSSPIFRRIQASRSIGYPTGLFIRKPKERESLKEVHDEFLPLNGGQITATILPSIRSSSGGLLLLQQKSSGFTDYIVCNPTTNEFKQLPLPPPIITDSPHVLTYLAFDPRKSPHYKILFMCPDNGIQINYVIYSSETEIFSLPKQLAITCSKYYLMYFIYGGYCNDTMHWILPRIKSFYCFNLNTEIMKYGQLPDGCRCCKYFGESRGHLHLVAIPDNHEEIFVYELKSDYSGWSVMFRINMKLMSNAFRNGDDMYCEMRRCAFSVLSITVDTDQDEKNLMLVLIANGYFVAYNCKAKQGVMLGGGYQLREVHDYQRFYSWPYLETLACV